MTPRYRGNIHSFARKLKTSLMSRGGILDLLSRNSPYLYQFFIVVSILCICLIIDIIWITTTHKLEVDSMKEYHSKRIGEYKKQFDDQLRINEAENRSKDSIKADKHKKEVNNVRDQHQQELDKAIESIQNQLNDLRALSKSYWDQHALANS